MIAKALSDAGLHPAASLPPFPKGPASDAGTRDPKRAPGFRQKAPDGRVADPGQFLSGSYCNAAGARNYRLYVPASHALGATNPPLIVMLHGCTQSPDDFATGTQMNRLAEESGFLVLYPEQSANANGSNCWNWFRAEDQQRERGEPSLLVGMVREVISLHGVDPARVFVAGLSAGAAMAVILGTTHPDVFAGIGAHSGLPYGTAHDVASAFAAMKGNATRSGKTATPRPGTSFPAGRAQVGSPVPTIVFHGDLDHTVDSGNGAEIARRAIAAYTGTREAHCRRDRLTLGNRDCTRIIYADAENRPLVAQWILHGAGHAWSGGDVRGSYVDACGPRASEEMVRFFLSQQRDAHV